MLLPVIDRDEIAPAGFGHFVYNCCDAHHDPVAIAEVAVATASLAVSPVPTFFYAMKKR